MSTLASSLPGLSPDAVPAARAGAPRAQAVPLRRARVTARTRRGGRGRSTLAASLALHLLVGGGLWTLGTPTPATPAPRAPQAAFVLPEAHERAAEPATPHEELAVHELAPVPPAAQGPEAELCEVVPAPDDLPSEPAFPDREADAPLPSLSAARRVRAPLPAPASATAVAAPRAAPEPLAAPAPPAGTAGRPMAAARAPDLPLDDVLGRLPRGLVVQLLLTVEADGRVSRVQVEVPSSSPHFDRAAEAWVAAQWRFAPSGQRFRTRVPFRLAGG